MHLEIRDDSIDEAYRRHIANKMFFIISSALGLCVLITCSIAVGSVEIPLSDVWQTLLGCGTGDAALIIWNIRLPRVLTAVVSGIGLAVAGTVMQSILRNPLSSPYTLGISHAAAFGAAFSILLFGAGTVTSSVSSAVTVYNPGLVTATAFISSMAATAALLLIAQYRGASPEVMILSGVALAALFTAGTTFLQFSASDMQVASMVFWTFGDVGRAGWRELGIITAAVLPCFIYFMLRRWDYNAMSAGDDTARSLGVAASRVRILGMALTALVTAVVVSFLGIIGFVGLVCPHIVRRIIGDDLRFLIPASGVLGGILLLGADTIARTIISPVVLPVGILTSFLGAPLFLYLLVRGRYR
jgi:iron complex transport system permease protein